MRRPLPVNLMSCTPWARVRISRRPPTAARGEKCGLFAGALALGLLLWLQNSDGAEPGTVVFGETILTIEATQGVQSFQVEVAQTPEQLARGLMYRTELAQNAGMLFLFPRERRVGMWMRNTLIPLDMIFITGSGQVAEVVPDTRPLSEEMITPRQPVQAVLEVRAGTAASLGIRPEDRVRWGIVEGEW